MILPIRCFTCSKVIGHLWTPYQTQLQENPDKGKEILDNLNLKRYCCRRMLLTNKEYIDNLIEYKN
jgi:DNA-directed RNA polymerases I, II, and III subunit RPABC5